MTSRRFVLNRHVDPTGISGTGIVAEGVEFSDGVAAVRWLGAWPTSVVFHDRGGDSLAQIHGHDGATSVQWLDDETEPDLAKLVEEAVTRALDRSEPKPPTRATRQAKVAAAQEPAAGPEPGPTPEPPTAPAPARIGSMVRPARVEAATPPADLDPEPEGEAAEADDPRRDDEVRAAEELAGRPLIPPGMPLPDGADYECVNPECQAVITRLQAIKSWSRFREVLCQTDFTSPDAGSFTR